MESKEAKKRVCVTISKEEHERLSRMAEETGRYPAGYMRWLLHKHFKELDKQEFKN